MAGMTMFEWNDQYRLNHPVIDGQHKRLFQLAGELHGAMLAGKGSKVLERTLDELINYTKAHFASEERLMQQSGYPGYAEHKIQHDRLTARVVDFQKTFQDQKATATIELMQFLKDWLTHHIGEVDRKVADHLSRRAA